MLMFLYISNRVIASLEISTVVPVSYTHLRAHERLVLEKMKSARINKSIEKQILLLPEVINLQPIPLALIIENIDLLSEIGFVIESFGAGMVIVREIPALIGHADIKQIIIDLGDDLSSAGLPSSYLAKVDLILGNIASHRSVR